MWTLRKQKQWLSEQVRPKFETVDYSERWAAQRKWLAEDAINPTTEMRPLIKRDIDEHMPVG